MDKSLRPMQTLTMDCTECGQPLSKPAEMAGEREIDNHIALNADPEYVEKNVPSDNAICSKCGRPYRRKAKQERQGVQGQMNTKLIGRTTQRFIRAFQDVHRILLELSKARWDVSFPELLKQAAKENSVVAAHASELANLQSLRKHTFNVWGSRSAVPSPAALAKLQRILESLHRATTRDGGKPTTDGPRAQGSPQKEPATRRISGTAAAVQVLMNRNNKEISIVELTAAAMKEGWSSNGKSPEQTLSSALHNEIRRRGRPRSVRQGQPAWNWKLTTAGIHYANEQICMALLTTEPDTGMRMALLMSAGDYSVVDEDDLEL